VTRPLLAAGAATAMLLVATVASGARGFSDPHGDTNTAPDLTSLEVSEAIAGVLTITATVGNFQALPPNSWVNLWFDVDSNAGTGDDAGDEALVRFLVTGELELFTWNGTQYAPGSTVGVTGSFAAGALTLTVPRASIGAPAAFGLLAVTSRGQPVGDEELVASDFLPNAGRSAFTGPGPTSFPDPAGDQDAAPDIGAVRVSDARNGWITFSITTPNYAVLPEQSAIIVSIDADDNPQTGDSGTELELVLAAGQMSLERWNGRRFVPDALPTRARQRNARNVVSIDLHVSELGNASRFRFTLLSADLNAAIQGIVALDVAPDDFSSWRYALANKPALKLTATRLFGTPTRPQAGKRFAVNLAVTRSDTHRPVSSGTVGCRVLADGKRITAQGSIAGGAGHCSFLVPSTAAGKVLRGTITVRTGGKSVAAGFSYVVR
jgi:hypothetical protein